jgi:hypothetical protein
MAKLLSGTRIYGNLTVDTTLSVSGNITQSGTNSYSAGTITTGATAAGTNQATAYAITTTSTQFTTVAAGTGAILPAGAIPGMRIFIANDAATPLLLYPATGGVIDQAAANSPIVVGGLGMLELMALTASNWTSISPDSVGTINQINVSQGNGNVVLSLSSTLVTPGYVNASGNVLGTSATFNNVVINTGNINAVGGYFVGNGAFLTGIATGGGGSSYSNVNLLSYLVSGIAGTIIPSANLTYNIGSLTAQWNTIYGAAVSAKYADLAEVYTSDQQYPAGTVVIFGGEQEVTQSRDSHDTRIAGVISTDPAYLMNSSTTGVPVALQGRVPCRVLGPVSKGDRVVSSHIPGVAQALDTLHYQPGCIIGKALEIIDSADISIIEVVVGRV